MLGRETTNLMIDVHALLPLIVNIGLTALGAIVILLIGVWLSGKANRLVNGMLARAPNFDAMLRSFFGGLVRYLVLAVTALAVLSQFGVQTASLLAIFGAVGLAVSLALQGTLSHLAAGIMLLIFRPFRSGHKVQVAGGSIGTVTDLTLFWTELVTEDKVQVIVPNAGIWGQPLRNFSIYSSAPVSEVRFRLAEGADLDKSLESVQSIVRADHRLLATPAPRVLFDHSAENDAVEVVVSFAAAADEAGAIKSDLIKAVHSVLEDLTVSH